MMDKGYTQSNFNIKNFDVVLKLPTGFNRFQHNITILPSVRTRRRNKINKIFNE
jgi:hypothetical protein